MQLIFLKDMLFAMVKALILICVVMYNILLICVVSSLLVTRRVIPVSEL